MCIINWLNIEALKEFTNTNPDFSFNTNLTQEQEGTALNYRRYCFSKHVAS